MSGFRRGTPSEPRTTLCSADLYDISRPASPCREILAYSSGLDGAWRSFIAAAITDMTWVWAMEQKARSDWNALGAAIAGAGCGIVLVMLHQAYQVASGHIQEANPFLHVMMEMVVVSLTASLVFVAGTALRFWLLPPKPKPSAGQSPDPL